MLDDRLWPHPQLDHISILYNTRALCFIPGQSVLNATTGVGLGFFAKIGITTMAQVQGGAFQISPLFWGFGVCYVVVGLLSKFLGCGLGAKLCKYSLKDSVRAGVGMMVRAEVVLICTQRGLRAGLVSDAVMPFVLAIILFSSIITPLVLKSTYREHELPKHPVDSVHNF